MKVFLIRHGESDWNEHRRVQGALDAPVLSRKGVKESERLKERMKSEKVDVVYSSPLRRSLQTAKIAFPRKKILVNKNLIERYYGKLEGKYWKDIERDHPAIFRAYYWERDLSGVKGEPLQRLQGRSVKAFNEIIRKHHGENIAVVCHGAVIKAIIAHLLGMPLNKMGVFNQGNCGITLLQHDERLKGFKVKCVNDTSHVRNMMGREFA
ncbi:MAG: histidine phosphatase family protein [Candidatus Aenigmarchaeota archaeon]|nr:histidine phosphatase family protein [Candidatus Aenigmarchaeota archaeon]